MAQKGDDGPSLELPSFGLRRKGRRRDEEPSPPAAPADIDTTAEERPDEPRDAVPPRATTAEPAPAPDRAPAPEPAAEPAPAPSAEDPAGVRRRPRRAVAAAIPDGVAVSLSGLAAGLVLVGLTWGSLHLCELVRGTTSCGTPGLALLLVAVVLAVLAGQALLSASGVADSGSISFLGVGLVTVVTLLMSDLLLEWWMFLIVPLVSVVGFVLAHWVSTAFVEPVEQPTAEDWMRR